VSSEIRFANSYSNFWNALLPMGEAFIRAQNAKMDVFRSRVPNLTPADQRGIVNEAGFLLFKRGFSSGLIGSAFDENAVTEALTKALARNERLPRSFPGTLESISTLGRFEATAIALNLRNHFAQEAGSISINPSLPGCGWVNDAEADVLCGTTLYEVKAGDRHFRLSDLRQLLVYCALNFSSKTYEIREVALFNPRSGAVIKVDLDMLCQRIAGTSSIGILGDIVSFISEPVSIYRSA
jgi:hypothetical protein